MANSIVPRRARQTAAGHEATVTPLYVKPRQEGAVSIHKCLRKGFLTGLACMNELTTPSVNAARTRWRSETIVAKLGKRRQIPGFALERSHPSEAEHDTSKIKAADRAVIKEAAIQGGNVNGPAQGPHPGSLEPQLLISELEAKVSKLSIRGGSGSPQDQHVLSDSSSVDVVPLLEPSSHVVQTRPLLRLQKRSALQINTAVRKIIEKPISSRELRSSGWIYAFDGQPWTVVGQQQPIKIGHTRRAVETRLAEIAENCEYSPRRLFAYPVPSPGKYEALVHATLWDCRRRETGACACKVKHGEWFAVDQATARSVVRMWACFAAQDPYDEEGVLKDEWKSWLESGQVDLGDVDCWERFIYLKFIDDQVDEFIKNRAAQRIARSAPGVVEAQSVTGGATRT